MRHWQEATITTPGLEDRGGVFFAAIEMTRMPMILTDPNQPDNPIVFANYAFFDLTGYNEDEVVGRNCRFLQGAQTDREQVAELRRAVVEERAISLELLNYRRDGSPFWNAVFIAPVHGRDGKLLYFFASQLDVTRRRMSEQAFRQAQKMEAIGQLTAGLAHDFNNLLQVVSGNLDFLRSKLTDGALQRFVDRASEATDRGTKLTKQLLAFARKTRLEPKVVDLNDLVHGFADLLDTTAGNRVDLEINLRRRIPHVHVDPAHLEMALLNVVLNARDAMPKGGAIRVATSVVTLDDNALPGGKYVALSVADDGEGMPAYVRERATEPFFTTKQTGKGTGLGLAMVQGFVQQSLGKLEIESDVGRGTTVRMLFPATSEAIEAAPWSLPSPAVEPRAGRDGAPETILVVEDNEDVLALARDHLAALGYRVIVARDADEALATLETDDVGRIDLLFSDLLMPGSMNGLVLAEKATALFPEMAVLLTTGYSEDLVVDGPTAPAMDVLGKPYRRTELADRVRAALNRKPGPVQPPQPRHVDGPRHEA